MRQGLMGMAYPPDPPVGGLWGRLLQMGRGAAGVARQAFDPTTPGWSERGVPGLVRGVVEGLQRNPIGTVVDFSPLGDAKALAYDAPREFSQGNTGMGLLALASAIPGIPGLGKLAGDAGGVVRSADLPMDEASRMARARDAGATPRSFEPGVTPQGFPPEFLRDEYPTPAPPRIAFDAKKQKEFTGRGWDTPNQEFWDARNAVQSDIDAGLTSPYFPEGGRYYANPQNYVEDASRSTSEALPKKQDTIDRITEQYDTPEVRDNLRAAFQLGSKYPRAADWYAVGQLEDKAIELLGPEKGPEWFRKQFAEAMAATTAGMDPTSNLTMAAWSNYRLARGLPLPVSHEIPRPTMGQYLGNNAAAGERVREVGLPPANNPKGFSFSRNFMGELWRATMDKQMHQGAGFAAGAPNNNAYPIFEGVMADEARAAGLAPANFQDVAWAGFKAAKDLKTTPQDLLRRVDAGESIPGVGMPMIAHINDAIERTAQLTQQSPDEVVRRWITMNAPLFSAAGLMGVLGARGGRESQGGG